MSELTNEQEINDLKSAALKHCEDIYLCIHVSWIKEEMKCIQEAWKIGQKLIELNTRTTSEGEG